MASLEETFQDACQARQLPNAVLISANKTGNFKYEQAFGKRSLLQDGDQSPVDPDSVMWIASCTKAMTSVAAMQCVERGQLSLDAPVYDLLPELRDLEIIESVDDDGNIKTKKNPTPITLKHLLTHSSGIGYDEMNPLLMAWRKATGTKPGGATLTERFTYPLLFEPGTAWMYGASVDWAGRLVERVTKTNLEAYMKQHLWAPLGITDFTFHLRSRPDLAARMTDLSGRPKPGAECVHMRSPFLFPDVVDDLGGQGVFGTPRELFKFVHALLLAANDGDERLLKRDTLEQLFTPQLTPSSRAALAAIMKAPEGERILPAASFAPETGIDWGLAGLLITTDVPGWTHAGTLLWSGLPNLNWWVDPKADLAVVYASQLIPPADPKAIEMGELFAREMYKRYGAAREKKL
ncbi:beta-lactamase family protein [Diplodia corticola]|uniref:Beta-lactamase family protein n=1 Tax=Diplodia corticola TaxID=236234 RepID=A0A1J9SJY5_9PEZI|nr:beta-lactamase family protein [Diplodia corticola]OJD40655.1 beta-lactamase family protein [Diplodia corticola]